MDGLGKRFIFEGDASPLEAITGSYNWFSLLSGEAGGGEYNFWNRVMDKMR